MTGEFLPEELADDNWLQTWVLSPNMMRDFSRLSNERRQCLNDAAGNAAVWLTKNVDGRDETAVDQAATAVAPLGLLLSVAIPGTIAADLAVLETGTEIIAPAEADQKARHCA